MKRYSTQPPTNLAYPWPDDGGEWVRYADAEAEIKKARQEHTEECHYRLESSAVASVRTYERERIADYVDRMGLETTAKEIRRNFGRPAQEPKPLEKLTLGHPVHSFEDMPGDVIFISQTDFEKINALVEHVQGIENWIARHDR